jgi:hypothetical protein
VVPVSLVRDRYVNDCARRGFVDGRSARLPTIVPRPGAPNKVRCLARLCVCVCVCVHACVCVFAQVFVCLWRCVFARPVHASPPCTLALYGAQLHHQAARFARNAWTYPCAPACR